MIELKHVYFQYGMNTQHAGYSTSGEPYASDVPRTDGEQLTRGEQRAHNARNTHDEQHTEELKDINLRIDDGELVLITGPSGCGKTTLLRLINGLIPGFYQGRVKGDILLQGRSYKNHELYDLARVVGTVFQNPRSQFYNVDTTSELAFACENQGLPKAEIYRRIDATVADLHMEGLMDRNIFHLSDGEKQKIACASIEVAGLNIILLDEPSANLDYDATLMLKQLILHWKQQGRTVVVAEHRIAYLWDSIDRLVIMKQGAIVKDCKVMQGAVSGNRNTHLGEIDASHNDQDTRLGELKESHNNQDTRLNELDLCKLGLRTPVMESPLHIDLPSVVAGDKLIELKNVTFSYQGTKKNIINISSLAIACNQITAIVGKNGAGKTTFLNCFCGLEKRCKGSFEYEGRALSNQERKKICFMVMQNTGNQLFSESVLDEVLMSLPKYTNKRQEAALNILRQLDLDFLAHRHPQSLSGGQKQRLAIACAVATGRKIVVLDEPTSGLDCAHMQEMARLLVKLQAMDTTIMVVAHDSEFIHACCTRLVRL